MMHKTKIVATIGPASSKPAVIRDMLNAGMDVARINFSHGDHESHTKTIAMLRRIALEEGATLALLGDLQGPKIRLGHVRRGGIPLQRGDEVVFTPHAGQPNMIHLPHPEIISALVPGARMVIGDGELEFTVAGKREDAVVCVATVRGLLESRKGVNTPGTELPISSITEKDREDLKLICQLKLDYVALSFVRSAEDIFELRQLMKAEGASIPVIAKIEKSEAIEELVAIRDASDGMMVARGDLGIDMPAQEVPLLQKRIIRVCNEVGKPVITATQMLQSMVEHPRPTRAEASDVANAILDGTDAIMLSGETAAGRYPVESVLMMKHISQITESAFPYGEWRRRRSVEAHHNSSVTEAISAASCAVAEELDAELIVCTTMSGHTATQIARHRPRTRILAISPDEATQRRLALVWGIQCVQVPSFDHTDDMVEQTLRTVRRLGFPAGKRIVITGGVPFGQSGSTNLIQVHEID